MSLSRWPAAGRDGLACLRAVGPAVLLAVVVLGGQILRAQQDAPPTFRVGVDGIEVDVSVTDRQGNPVTGLTIDDFELFENGVRQTITSFSSVSIPIERVERGSAAAVAPDVQTNDRLEGRLFVIALDEIGPSLALRTRQFLRRFIEQHFGPNDVAAVVSIGRGSASATQDFTSDPRLLLAAIDRYSGGFPDAMLPSHDRMSQLRELLEYLGTVRGRRKAMIYVTRGVGNTYDVLDYTGGTRSLEFQELHAALAAATRSNVAIYPIDPAGLSPATGPLGERQSPPSVESLWLASLASMERAMDLRAMAAATGGFAVVNTNSFDRAFARIVREHSAYYLLGFTSSNDRRDGRYRRVDVRVNRPDVRIQARNGYVAPLGTTPEHPGAPENATLAAPVAGALRLPLMDRAIPMTIFAAPYKASGRTASVAIAVEMDASRLELVDRGESIDGVVQMAAVVIDASGRRRLGEEYRMEMAMRPYTWVRAQTHGVRVLHELELPPGRYQLRIAAGNVAGRNAGSVIHHLEVPDFTRGSLVMSGVTVTAASARDAVTTGQRMPLGDVLPAPPMAGRVFDRDDGLVLYAEVYDNRRARDRSAVTLVAELRTDRGVRVAEAIVAQPAAHDPAAPPDRYRFLVSVPLDVEPGSYVLRVEAHAADQTRPAAGRDIPIDVN